MGVVSVSFPSLDKWKVELTAKSTPKSNAKINRQDQAITFIWIFSS